MTSGHPSSSIRLEVKSMTSRKLLPLTGIAVWAAVILTSSPRALPQRHSPIFLVLADEERGTSEACQDLHIRFDHNDAIYQSEERSIPRSEVTTLRVQAHENGGLRVHGWDQDAYGVTLCKAVEGGGDAQKLFSQIHLNYQAGDLSVSGPESNERWVAFLLIRAPKNAALDLKAYNGPLSVKGVDGKVEVHAINGPITIADCTGELDVEAQNGPLSLDGNGGKVNARAENGPLSVSLNMPGWNGSGMEAHVDNGPLTLHVPTGYTSGVLLESNGSGPFSCASAACSEGRKTWDDDRKSVAFGSGPTVVRVSAENGPISVH
jgi:hypothetical protein